MNNVSKTVLRVMTLAGTTLFANSASAQMSYYGGAGLSYSSASSQSASSSSEGDLFGLSLTSGIRFDTSSSIFYGAEIDGEINLSGDLAFTGNGLTCADGSAADAYFCDQNATLRLRGLVGTNIGGFDVFGTVGYGAAHGLGAIDEDGSTQTVVSAGLTYGVGAQTSFGGGTARLEVIRDDFSNNLQGNFDPEWSATSVKASYLWSF